MESVSADLAVLGVFGEWVFDVDWAFSMIFTLTLVALLASTPDDLVKRTFECDAVEGTKTGLRKDGQGVLMPPSRLPNKVKNIFRYNILINQVKESVYATVSIRKGGKDLIGMQGKHLIVKRITKLQPNEPDLISYAISPDHPDKCDLSIHRDCEFELSLDIKKDKLGFTYFDTNYDNKISNYFFITGTCREL
jgi:hypothetical protein